MSVRTNSNSSQRSNASTKKIHLEELIDSDDDLQQTPIKSRNSGRVGQKKAIVEACVERLSKPKTFPSIEERYATYRGRARPADEIRTITDRLYANNSAFGKNPSILAERCPIKTSKQIQDINRCFYEDLAKLEEFSARTKSKWRKPLPNDEFANVSNESNKRFLTNEDVCRLYRKAIQPKDKLFTRPVPERKRLLDGKFSLKSAHAWEGHRAQHPWQWRISHQNKPLFYSWHS